MFNAIKAYKNSAKTMKTEIKKIINDLEIIKEAINNNDNKDAIQMLDDLKQDLILIDLIS